MLYLIIDDKRHFIPCWSATLFQTQWNVALGLLWHVFWLFDKTTKLMSWPLCRFTNANYITVDGFCGHGQPFASVHWLPISDIPWWRGSQTPPRSCSCQWHHNCKLLTSVVVVNINLVSLQRVHLIRDTCTSYTNNHFINWWVVKGSHAYPYKHRQSMQQKYNWRKKTYLRRWELCYLTLVILASSNLLVDFVFVVECNYFFWKNCLKYTGHIIWCNSSFYRQLLAMSWISLGSY